jgi:ABC-2 type transport system permease protein
MKGVFGAITAVIIRELIRFWRQKGRLISTFARPLLWLVVIGAGFTKIVPTTGSVSYKQFLLPGIFGMVVLFSSMLSALATVHDREFGPIRMILIAPVPRSATVIAKTLAATLIGVIQAIVLLPLIWILGLRPSANAVFEVILAITLVSFAISALGMVIASRLRSIENFAGVMNFLMFPIFFLSCALYPASTLPGFLQPVSRADPLTYGVDLMRHPLLQGLYPGNLGTDYSSMYDVWVMLGIGIVLLILACLLFGEEDHLGKILLTEAPRKKVGRSYRLPLGRGKDESGPAGTGTPAPAPAVAAAAPPRPAPSASGGSSASGPASAGVVRAAGATPPLGDTAPTD